MKIILLRGLAREAGHWLDFPAQLQKALGNGWQLELIDLPGCGQWHQQAACDSIATTTDAVRRQLASDEPVYLLGISMGAMVALDWAQRFPQQVRGLVLINSSAGDQPLHWRLRPRAWPLLLLALLLPIAWREALVLRQVSNNREYYPTHLQTWLRIQQQHPVSRRNIVRMLTAAARFRPAQHCILPGLVLASEGDRFVSPLASRELAARFNWPLQLHPSAGHDLPLDAPQWLCTQISQWLASH